MTTIPRANMDQILIAAGQISNGLNRTFFWHENFSTLARVLKGNQVVTNVGVWVFYGMAEPKVVDQRGDVQITKAAPHSYHLIASSEIPTSQQKIMLLDLLVAQVSKRLGAPPNAITHRMDPTKGVREEGKLVQVETQATEKAATADPYKSVREPYVISVTWPATESDPRWAKVFG